MFLRRSATALAVATALCTVAAPAAAVPSGASAGKKLPDALYGKGDPKFDGVWRQSVALLAQDAAGAVPAEQAVDWLAGQQCGDGSFAAYRPSPDSGCDAGKTPADTNATGIAVQALAAVGGREDTVRKSVKWLRSVQNEDGGWGYGPNAPSDANSVSVVIGALAAAGEKPGAVEKKGKSPYDALVSFQLGCDAEPGERGAFAYQPDKKGRLAPNDDATAAASLAGTGQGILLAEPLGDGGGSEPVRPLDCGEDAEGPKGSGKEAAGRAPGEAAEAGDSYLASVVKKNKGYLKSAMPGAGSRPDYANTADAVVALAAGGHRSEADYALNRLEKDLGEWDKARDDPAAIGSVMLARHATGEDPAAVGGTDLLGRLSSTGPAPAKMPAAADRSAGREAGDDGGSSIPTWSMLVVGLAAGAGIGFLLSGRRKKQNK